MELEQLIGLLAVIRSDFSSLMVHTWIGEAMDLLSESSESEFWLIAAWSGVDNGDPTSISLNLFFDSK